MRALFIYNQHSAEDVKVMERAKQEMPTLVEIVEINQASPELRQLIRATPALIPVVDDLQGEYIKGEGVDGQLLVTAELYRWLEREEQVVNNQETYRLDNFINGEKIKAIDDYTIELIEGGVI